MTYFKKFIYTTIISATLFSPVVAMAEESKDIKELRASIASVLDRIQKQVFKNDVKPDNSVTKHDKKDCVCKGTGRIIHGDGHSTTCPCDICGCNVKKDEPIIIVQPVIQEAPASVCVCTDGGECTCENCECVKPEKLVKNEEPKVLTEENANFKIVMYGASWCGPCLEWERDYSDEVTNKGWFFKKIDVEKLKEGESVPTWVQTYPSFSVTINGKTYNSQGKLPMALLRKYLTYEHRSNN